MFVASQVGRERSLRQAGHSFREVLQATCGFISCDLKLEKRRPRPDLKFDATAKKKTNKQTNKQKCLQAFFRKPEGNMPPGKRRLIWGVNFTTQLTERGKKAVE